jgi:hypothetical protein
VAGEAVVCPFQSTSKEGSDSIDDCVCEAGLSLIANTTCGVVGVAAGSPMSPGAIAGIVAGGVVAAGVVVGGLWVYFPHNVYIGIKSSNLRVDPAAVGLLDKKLKVGP